MMNKTREIKFRGKYLKTGEWVYGNLIVNNPGKCWIVGKMIESNEEYCIIEYWYPVVPVTVSLYIGQEDINGVKIFAGDIVKANLCEPGYMYVAHPYVCEVVFKGLSYILKVIDHADKSGFKPGKVPKISMQYSYIKLAGNLTIIGNRWDNPELLGVK